MNPKEQFDQAVSLLRSRDFSGVAKICDEYLEQHPGDANFLCLAGRANLALKNFSAAESHIEDAIRLFPDFALAHETYGDLLLAQGNVAGARSAFQTATRLDPSRSESRKKVDYARKIEKDGFPKSVKSPPMHAAQEIAQAREHEKNGDPQSAEMIYREILKRDPNHVEAARLLAGIAAQNKRFRDAEVFLKKALSNDPDYTSAWVDLANVQRELDRFDEAIESAKQVLRLAPDRPESHMVHASAIGMSGDHNDAIRAYQRALDIDPARAGALCGMAHHQKTIGQQDEAIASYRRAIKVKPDHAESYWSLANLKTFSFADHEVEAMQTLLKKDELPDESRAQLHNALGLEFEGRKDYAEAFDNFRQCNVVRRQMESYDPVDTEDTYTRIIDQFDATFLQQTKNLEDLEVTPIFVVGLPRSGSTLLEQILASHSQVEGTHELGDLQRSVQSSRRSKARRARFPEALADFNRDDWREIGKEYLSRTEIFRSGSPYFVDKNPNNFVYAGVLQLAIPNAKIINARRHPLDSCFGSYKQLFASGQPFTYDITELAEYYLQYQRLMDHWRDVLPGFVLDVHYEEVVGDLEGQVRRILDFCGLPFEETCLSFHETERAVKTASSEQVRRPLYSSSVNLWRNYDNHLDELVHILEPLLINMPPDQRPSRLNTSRPDGP